MTRKTSFPLKSPWGPWGCSSTQALSCLHWAPRSFAPTMDVSASLMYPQGASDVSMVVTTQGGLASLKEEVTSRNVCLIFTQVRGKVQAVLLPGLSPSPSCTFSRVQSMGSRQLLCIRGPHLPGLHLLRDLISSASVTFTARHSACIRWSVQSRMLTTSRSTADQANGLKDLTPKQQRSDVYERKWGKDRGQGRIRGDASLSWMVHSGLPKWAILTWKAKPLRIIITMKLIFRRQWNILNLVSNSQLSEHNLVSLVRFSCETSSQLLIKLAFHWN